MGLAPCSGCPVWAGAGPDGTPRALCTSITQWFRKDWNWDKVEVQLDILTVVFLNDYFKALVLFFSCIDVFFSHLSTVYYYFENARTKSLVHQGLDCCSSMGIIVACQKVSCPKPM